MNPKVDEFLDKAPKWQLEMKKLRMIVLDCMLTEEFKWKQPCYTFNNSNVLIIGGFKDYCLISFLKGSLLKDDNGLLIKPGEHTQSGRYMKFTNTHEIETIESILKAYIFEAIEVEKTGVKVNFKPVSDYSIPEELTTIFTENSAFKLAFEALTPGRQKAYILYFSAPKQSKTRVSRIEKYMNQIFEGKGLTDCTCGLSKKMPYCDGSHKYIR